MSDFVFKAVHLQDAIVHIVTDIDKYLSLNKERFRCQKLFLNHKTVYVNKSVASLLNALTTPLSPIYHLFLPLITLDGDLVDSICAFMITNCNVSTLSVYSNNCLATDRRRLALGYFMSRVRFRFVGWKDLPWAVVDEAPRMRLRDTIQCILRLCFVIPVELLKCMLAPLLT